MTNEELDEFLRALAVRAADLIERECAIEEGRDHHVVLVFLAAGQVILGGFGEELGLVAKHTAALLGPLSDVLSMEMARRAAGRDPNMH